MTDSIIRPTVGRRLWYWPSEADTDCAAGAGMKRLHSEPPQPFDAGVVLVWGDRLVNLLITDHQGYTHRRTSVDLLQEGDAVPETGGYATWMPYQTKAAKKDEVAPAPLAYPIRTVRDEFLMTLVHGAAEKVALSGSSNNAELIADNILAVVNKLHPQAVLVNPHTGQPRDPRDVTSDPHGHLIVAPGAPLLAAKPAGKGDAIEQEIQAKGLTAPRVTPADVQANIASAHCFIVSDAIQHPNAVHECGEAGWLLGATQLLTICVLQLRNGFTVTGESACASPENFDAELGRKIARQNAEQKIWPLMGYELRSRLAGQ